MFMRFSLRLNYREYKYMEDVSCIKKCPNGHPWMRKYKKKYEEVVKTDPKKLKLIKDHKL